MFDPNSPAYPSENDEEYFHGPTFFQQCAKDFTAAALPYCLAHYESHPTGKGQEVAAHVASRLGILAAEEFCRLMEEREKDA